MKEDEFLDKMYNSLRDNVFTGTINGVSISNNDLLRVLLSKLRALNYEEWLENGKLKNNSDFRFQLFIRLELAVLHYCQSIEATQYAYKHIWRKTKEFGYNNQFTTSSVTFLEVSLRTNFIDTVFFTVDYFLQQMNSQIAFSTATGSHNKQQLFAKMLASLGLDQSFLETKEIVNDLIGNIPSGISDKLFVQNGNRKIPLHETYTYLVALRNCLHNNGSSSKTLNTLNIGGIQIRIEKDKEVEFGHQVVFIACYLMLEPLKRIVEQTFTNYPDSFWIDPYTENLTKKLGD